MNSFTYIIAEGVLDVVLLTQVLRRSYGFTVIEKKSDLSPQALDWLNYFKWPVGENIVRRAVPAPAILQLADSIVGIQNGQGVDEIAKTARQDEERFLRLPMKPCAWAAVLDADDVDPATRFAEFAKLAAELDYPQPTEMDKVVESGGKRAGVFAFPGDGQSGTIEDVLLPLAAARFGDLGEHAQGYVNEWQKTDDAKNGTDFKELWKPRGPEKACLSAMAALLKPGKPLNASVQDQKWIPDDPYACDALKPLMSFLDQLLDT